MALLFDTFRNYVNTLTGVNQEFEQLLESGDISAALRKMNSNREVAGKALKEYTTSMHRINERPDKPITDKKGNLVRMQKTWKLPIPYPVYINEIALVFLYGRPVRWSQNSEETDNAFQKFTDIIFSTRFNAKLRQCKRLAGSETESAMLFRVFKDDNGKPDVQIRVLAASKGDEIFAKWDTFENLTSFAWGYYAKESEDKTVYHCDIYTRKKIYHCAKRSIGWEVDAEPNLIGKIPVLLFQQEKEWAGVENLIHREEYIASTTADTNDYFSNPVAIMNSDVIKNLPEKNETGKLLVTNGQNGVNEAAKYLTWDSAPQSKKDEIEWLQEQILTMTFTPKISLETLRSLGNLSGKALRTAMMLADIKANKHKESHDEMLSRASSLIIAIIRNVMDVSLVAECERLKITHEFQEPFGDDVASSIDNIVRAVDAGIFSREAGIEANPLVKDPVRELERIKAEAEEGQQKIMDVFAEQNGENGPEKAE